MSDIPASEQCMHMGCGCAPGVGENYCGSHCEGTPYEESCGCGHADCQPKASVS